MTMTLHARAAEVVEKLRDHENEGITSSDRFALREAAATLIQELAAGLSEWRDMDAAPKDGTRVLLLLESGGIIAGEWVENAGVTSDETLCGMWGAADEEIWPTSWTDGLCWASNADEVSSDQPVAWSPLPLPAAPTPEGEAG
jgi:hypothetical protein